MNTENLPPEPKTEIKQETCGDRPSTACSPLLVIPRDAAQDARIKELKDAGYLVIVTDSPEKVRLVTPEMAVDHSDMVMAAMKALSGAHANTERAVFIAELFTRMKNREANV